jgi:hypothetical protein
VGARFEERDWRRTPLGEISLRRRDEGVPTVDVPTNVTDHARPR